ncbi:MAG: hypothetical protein ACK2TU_12295, partial [Anaerolineales bacterium]
MQQTVCNPQKGRLGTIQVEYTEGNTTWLDNIESSEDIYRVTDYNGGVLIKEFNYTYPVWV